MIQSFLQSQPKSFWKKWPSQSRDLISVTEDKTESRKSHKQAASEGRRGRRGRGNTGFIDVHGFQTLSNY